MAKKNSETVETPKALERIIVDCGEIFPDYSGSRIVARKTASVDTGNKDAEGKAIKQGYTYEISMPACDVSTWNELIGMPEKECLSKLAKTIMHSESWFTPTVNERIKDGKAVDSDEFLEEIRSSLTDALQYTERKASKASRAVAELAELKAKQSTQDALMKKMLGLAEDCSEEDYIAAMAKAAG